MVAGPLTIQWMLLLSDGRGFSLEGLRLRLFAVSGRGRREIKDYSISGDENNILTMTLDCRKAGILGDVTLRLLTFIGEHIYASAEYRNAFRALTRAPLNAPKSVSLTSMVSVDERILLQDLAKNKADKSYVDEAISNIRQEEDSPIPTIYIETLD